MTPNFILCWAFNLLALARNSIMDMAGVSSMKYGALDNFAAARVNRGQSEDASIPVRTFEASTRAWLQSMQQPGAQLRAGRRRPRPAPASGRARHWLQLLVSALV